MKFKTFRDKAYKISAIGQGTGIGGYKAKLTIYNNSHVEALRLGIDLGMNLIDTAEEYGDGQAEITVGKAVKGLRDKVFIATKFSPRHSSYNDVLRAAENSLRRLQTDYIDLYQIHWPNPCMPLEDTLRAMCVLVKSGKVRHIGICNFMISGIKNILAFLSDIQLASIQLEYNLFDRSIEKNILPFCQERNISVIGYSPLDQGRVVSGDKKTTLLQQLAEKHDKTIAQIILNWLVSHPGVVVIPNATNQAHLRENAVAADFNLSKEDKKLIDDIFIQEPEQISVSKIKVIDNKNPNSYRTVQDAIENRMRFVPSPLELSKEILAGEEIKPIRVRRLNVNKDGYEFDLLEGRVRYWAWVIAYGNAKAIPAYIR